MIEYNSIVQGDFSLSTMGMRLLAPNIEKLIEIVPDLNPNMSLKEWAKYSKGVKWENEMQNLLYVGNFIHEYIHSIQFTTLEQCIYQTYKIHSLIRTTYQFLKKLKECHENKIVEKVIWPPQVPLFEWLEATTSIVAHPLFATWIETGFQHDIFQGRQERIDDYCKTLNKQQKELFPDPFHPHVSFLNIPDNDELSEAKDQSITVKMLLESQATMYEFIYLATFYDRDVAYRLVFQRGFDKDYQLLPYISLVDGMFYLFPVIVDWAFEGSEYFNLDEEMYFKYFKKLHPSWRFVKLYNASKILLSEMNIPSENIKRLMSTNDSFRDFKKLVYRKANIKIDRKSKSEFVKEFHNSPIYDVILNNCNLRDKEPKFYANIQIHLNSLIYEHMVPNVQFRETPLISHHFGPQNDPLKNYLYFYFSRIMYDINRMIEGSLPKCPFCEGTEYKDINGRISKKIPPIGFRLPVRLEENQNPEDIFKSKICNCSWSIEFHNNWGVWPEEISLFNMEGQ